MEVWKTILGVIIDICILIPMAVTLVRVVREAVRSRNWNILVKLVAELMAKAEIMYSSGADKKAWVIAELEAIEATLNFDIDYDVVSDLIDRLCDMSKIVNGPEAK